MEWSPKALDPGGPYEGIRFAEVDPAIGKLATTPDGQCDWRFLKACRGEAEPVITLDDAYDIAEVREVARSWHDATRGNAQLKRKGWT